jgi:peptide deformylase
MPKQLPILIHPNPVLRKKSTAISPDELQSREMQELLLDLEETMHKKDGAGLAAPQVGKNIRVCVVQDDQRTIFMVNPQITKKSWARETEEEGCLSILNDRGEIIYALVARHKKISCVYLDKKGQLKKIKAEHMLARAIQHEIDHLDGILFIDKIETKPSSQRLAA